jgi:hypothetical protein
MHLSSITTAKSILRIWMSALSVLCFFVLAVLNTAQAQAQTTVQVGMSPTIWQTTGEANFIAQTGFPHGVLELKKGSAIPTGIRFLNGTIEFDLRLAGHGIVGLKFREQNKDNAEVLYFRPQPHCDTSTDCLQYMPIAHAGFEWDLYSQFQSSAPVRSDGWNHVKLVVSGRRMNVFINGSTKPTLSVGRLAGELSAGTLDFHGPASLSNLVIYPDKVSGLSPVALCNAQCKDPRFLRSWEVSSSRKEPTEFDKDLKVDVGVEPRYGDAASGAWRPLNAEPDGLVNLTREIGSARAGGDISLVWVRAFIDSNRDQNKRVSIGWIREAWVYSSGKLVFADRNLYGVDRASKAPDGRLGLENGSFVLPLHKGRNEIMIAVDDNLPGNTQHYGWGVELRLDDLRGIVQSRSSKLSHTGA